MNQLIKPIYLCIFAITVFFANNSKASSDNDIVNALNFIQDRTVINNLANGTFGIGMATMNLGWVTIGLVAETNSTGAFTQALKPKALSLGRWMVKWGFRVGGVGAVLSLIIPEEAQAGTMTNYYMSSEHAFAEFLSFPRDQQLFFAKIDPKLEDFIITFAESIEKIEESN